MLKVVGVDRVSGKPRALRVKTSNERRAWERAEAKGIIPHDVTHLPTSAAAEKKPDLKGVVYLLQCGGYFKIGKSVNAERRYGELRVQLPEKPRVVHEIWTNDVNYCERHWHKRFASVRANGEWFNLGQEDVTEFVRCKRMVVKRA